MDEERKQLGLLAKLHYVLGGVTALFACFPLIHVAVGISLLTGKFPVSGSGGPPPAMIGWLFLMIGSILVLIGWSLAACIILAGRKLSQYKNWTFCLVVAAVQCMIFPFGTILGVVTIISLTKDPVKQLFGRTV